MKEELLIYVEISLILGLNLNLSIFLIMKLPYNAVCRVKANPKNAINEHMLPEFLDFIVWGHEHECLVDPQVPISIAFSHICNTHVCLLMHTSLSM